eukprot:m.106632 g.106632  ORF g.106632 m.106632 type:complete len:106 (+) comp51680_c0_seq3:31-348(+)
MSIPLHSTATAVAFREVWNASAWGGGACGDVAFSLCLTCSYAGQHRARRSATRVCARLRDSDQLRRLLVVILLLLLQVLRLWNPVPNPTCDHQAPFWRFFLPSTL